MLLLLQSAGQSRLEFWIWKMWAKYGKLLDKDYKVWTEFFWEFEVLIANSGMKTSFCE